MKKINLLLILISFVFPVICTAANMTRGASVFSECHADVISDAYELRRIKASISKIENCPTTITTKYRVVGSEVENMIKTKIYHLNTIRKMDSGVVSCDYNAIPYVYGSGAYTSSSSHGQFYCSLK